MPGWWWLPENPEYKIPGIAIIKQGYGATLKAMAAFPRNGKFRLDDVPVVHGKTEQNIVTLLHSCEGREDTDRDPVRYSFYLRSKIAVIGAHVLSPDFPISSINIHYTNANQWADIDRGIEEEQENEAYTISALVAQPIEEIVADIDDRFSVLLKVENHPEGDANRKMAIVSTTRFEIKTSYGERFYDFDRIIRGIQNLLTLFVHQPVYVESLTLQPAKSEMVLFTRLGSVKLYQEHGYEIDGNYKPFHRSRMLVPLRQIQGELSEILKVWLCDAENFDLSYHLYFSVVFNKELYAENRFLAYVQALEGYHRRKEDDSKYLPKAEYKARISGLLQAIPDDLPGDLKTSIESAIQRANDFSLRERLGKIMKRRGETFLKTFFGNLQQHEDFIQQVVGTRNYLSHVLEPGDVKKMYRIDDDEFDPTIERLQVLVEASLLEITGIAQDKIDSILLKRFSEYPIYHKVEIDKLGSINDREEDGNEPSDLKQ